MCPPFEPSDYSPPVKLLPDNPTALDIDDFAHRFYVEVLIAAVSTAEQPTTIGLLGRWGVGKSSVLLALRDALPEQAAACIIFDAWRYDGATLRRQLLRDVAHGLQARKALPFGFRVERRMEELDVDHQETVTRFRPRLAGFLLALIQAAVVAAGVAIALQFDAVTESLHATDIGDNLALILAPGLITFAGATIGQAFQPQPIVRTRRRTEDAERFESLFRDLVSACRRRRLVIAVDNLDRCAPEVALELLSTIKTYLEPAAREARGRRRPLLRLPGPKDVDTDVLFVIGVDDEALRRHLSAAGEDDASAREYLRKIFTASIRILSPHAEDLRAHALSKVKDMPSLRLDDADARQLAGLLGAALRTTPRQTLQFLNDLQLRLAVARARQAGEAPAVAEPISDRPLLVAKLGLVEECWPHRHRELVDAPQKLDEWHRQAREPIATTGLEPAFAAFLRLSDSIQATNLRPYMAARQPADERDLPEYAAFRLAAVTSDRAEVAEILDRAGDDADAYLERLDDIFAEEVRAADVLAARSVVDIALNEPRLGPEHSLTGGLVREVIDNPLFHEHRDALAAAPFLEAASHLNGTRPSEAVDQVIRRLTSSDPQRAAEAAAALAAHADRPDERQSEHIRQQTTTPPVIENTTALLALGRARADWLSPTAADGVAMHIQQSPGILDGDGAAEVWDLVELVAGNAYLESGRQRLAEVLAAHASTLTVSATALPRAVDAAAVLGRTGIDLMPLVTRWTAALSEIGDRASAAARTIWPLCLGPAYMHLDACVRVLLTDDDGVSFLAEQANDLDDTSSRIVAATLADALVGARAEHASTDVIEVLRRLDPDRFPERALVVALAWSTRQFPIEQQRWLVAEAGIEVADVATAAELAIRVASSATTPVVTLRWLNHALSDIPVSDAILAAASTFMDDHELLGQRPDAELVQSAFEAAMRISGHEAEACESVAERALDALDDLDEAEVISIISTLASRRGALSSSQRTSLRTKVLRLWREVPQRREELKALLETLRLDAGTPMLETQAFIAEVLRLERATTNPQDRMQLLTFAVTHGEAEDDDFVTRRAELAASPIREDRWVAEQLGAVAPG